MTDDADKEQAWYSDPETMRALAHPARWKVIDHLGAADDATATECAAVVGLSPSAMSYHLRALAKAGLIEEAEGRGDGRERVWRKKMHGFSVAAGYGATESAILAERAMTDAVFGVQFEELRSWLHRQHDESREWYEAAHHGRTSTYLTAEEVTELSRRIGEVIRHYFRKRQDKPDDARRVAIMTHIFPVD